MVKIYVTEEQARRLEEYGVKIHRGPRGGLYYDTDELGSRINERDVLGDDLASKLNDENIPIVDKIRLIRERYGDVGLNDVVWLLLERFDNIGNMKRLNVIENDDVRLRLKNAILLKKLDELEAEQYKMLEREIEKRSGIENPFYRTSVFTLRNFKVKDEALDIVEECIMEGIYDYREVDEEFVKAVYRKFARIYDDEYAMGLTAGYVAGFAWTIETSVGGLIEKAFNIPVVRKIPPDVYEKGPIPLYAAIDVNGLRMYKKLSEEYVKKKLKDEKYVYRGLNPFEVYELLSKIAFEGAKKKTEIHLGIGSFTLEPGIAYRFAEEYTSVVVKTELNPKYVFGGFWNSTYPHEDEVTMVARKIPIEIDEDLTKDDCEAILDELDAMGLFPEDDIEKIREGIKKVDWLP